MIIKLAAGFAGLLLGVATLPLLAAPGTGASSIAGADTVCGDVATILATIRTLESGGNYTAHAANSTASGAYQYIDSTWRYWATTAGVDTARYPTAASAAPADQDTAAAADVQEILTAQLQDVTTVPIVWYLPSALNNPAAMDTVPAGNTLTPRQYQTKWMGVYQRLQADTPADSSACSGTVTDDGNWALPAPRDILANAGINQPHHDYPAVDLMMPAGTPVFAITAGHVMRTTHFNANWWTAGCTSDSNAPTGCATCGMGITIQSDNGLRHTYCHNSVLYATDGDTVVTGQHIADSGDTGRSGAPHLHLELHYDNTRRCPQTLVAALYNKQPPPNLANLPTAGCSF